MLLLNIPVHGHNCHTLSGGTETFFVKPVYHQYEPYIGQDQTLHTLDGAGHILSWDLTLEVFSKI